MSLVFCCELWLLFAVLHVSDVSRMIGKCLGAESIALWDDKITCRDQAFDSSPAVLPFCWSERVLFHSIFFEGKTIATYPPFA